MTPPERDSGSQESQVPAAAEGITAQPGPAGERKGADEPQGSPTTASTPSVALQQARELHRLSHRLANTGNPGGAYREASRAWQLVSQFPGDPACATLTRQLLVEMESLGEKANRTGAAEDAGRMLMER